MALASVRTESNVVPRCAAIIAAMRCCCLFEQCISIERITGSWVVMNAHAATALVTSRKVSLVQKVWPVQRGKATRAGRSMAVDGVAAAAACNNRARELNCNTNRA